MIQTHTRLYHRNWQAIDSGKRKLIRQGGTSSSKTFSNLQTLIDIALITKNKLISVVSESMPHLKRGCIRDFTNIMGDHFDPKKYNKTESTYNFNGSVIEFFSADDPSKLRGGRRDILFLNEANNIPKPAYDELESRTKEFVILDFNPVSEFWAHEMIEDEDTDFDISTYNDAKHLLPESIVKSIESRREKDPNWYRVYGEGQIGQLEGVVFPTFNTVDSWPNFPCTYGIDFGFKHDPTAIVRVTQSGEDIYIDELLYRTEMHNADIIQFLKSQGVKPHEKVWCDLASSQNIDMIYRAGFNAEGAPKPRGSIQTGIDYLSQYNIKVTKRSTNLIKELRNYQWARDKEGKYINEPVDLWNHAIDATRYALAGKIKPVHTTTPITLKI